MSASREKSKRKEQTAGGAGAGKKKGMSKGLKWTLGIICLVLVIAIVAFFTMLTNGFFVTHTTAAVVDGHSITPATLNYFYKDAYNNFYQTYQSYISYILDTTKPLDEQVYDKDTGETWADYFTEQALQNATQTYAIYDEAAKNGYTLTDDEKTSIDTSLESLSSSATSYGYSSLNGFLAAQFGTGCNEKNYRSYLELTQTAQGYATKVDQDFTYSDTDISDEYAANPNDYDGVDFRVFPVTASLFETTDASADSSASSSASSAAASSSSAASSAASSSSAVDPETAAKEESMASAMADDTKGDEQAFIDQAYQNAAEDAKTSYEDDSYTLKSDVSYSSSTSSYNQELADWLFDASRQNGDTTYIASTDGYFVAFFVSREDHDYDMANVRQILISVSDTTDTDAMATAKAKAEDLLAQYEAGDKTEDSFAKLATDNSDDTATTATGGLYENVVPGQMVTSFNDWCYKEDHKAGDTGIIESSYGYHVMYYVGTGDNYRDYLVENALRSKDYSAWLTALTKDAKYTENAFGMRFTTK